MKTFFDDMPETLKEDLDKWFTKKYALISKIEGVAKIPPWEIQFDKEFGKLEKFYGETMAQVCLRESYNNKCDWLKHFIRSLIANIFKKVNPSLSLACQCISVDPMYRRGFADASHFYEDARLNAIEMFGTTR